MLLLANLACARLLAKEILSEGLRPTPVIPVSHWANGHRKLTTASGLEAGDYRWERVPYAKKIMDLAGPNSPTQEIVIMKAAQLGLTEALLNVFGYHMHLAPCPMMLVLPSDKLL